MTRRDRRALRFCYLLLALLPVAAFFSGQAHASPETVQDYAFRNATAICALLGQDDSDAGIEAVLQKLWAVGVSPFQSGEVLYLAVDNVCPGHEARVLAWAHTATGVSPTYKANAHVGGAVGA